MTDKALDAVQSALENVTRVWEERGDMETSPTIDGEEVPVYSLGIAIHYLNEAERLLEEA